MKILLIANFSDRRCGFQNYAMQTLTALARAGHDVTAYDGTYSAVYARQQTGDPGFLPPDAATYDVIHVIWHALTLNHYSGCTWPAGPLLSWWDGGPSNASCPFADSMQVRWSAYTREGYAYNWYPIPDWIPALPDPPTAFTVGATSVRGDGVAEIRQVCEQHGWATNLPVPDQWLPIEDEVRRLARSTVNVCWYDTPAIWLDRAGAPSMALASHRPLLITDDSLLGHLHAYQDLYHGKIAKRGGPTLDMCLSQIAWDHHGGSLRLPGAVLADLSWTRAAEVFTEVWAEARGEACF